PPMPRSPARKPMSKPPATRAEASVAISLKGKPEIMGSVQREGGVNAAADYRGTCGFAIAAGRELVNGILCSGSERRCFAAGLSSAQLRHGMSIGPLNRRPDWKGMGNDRACLDGLRGGATHHLHGSAFVVRLGEHAAAMHDERAAPHSAVGRSASRMVRSALEMRVSQSRKGYLSPRNRAG